MLRQKSFQSAVLATHWKNPNDKEIKPLLQPDLYGPYRDAMKAVMEQTREMIEASGREYESLHGEKLYEHLICRIKSDESMAEKLRRYGCEADARHALRAADDAIGIRVICLFSDDVSETARRSRAFPGCTIVREKDYIRNAKPNGYRSYHLILDVEADQPDIDGHIPGHYLVEIQLRTIAMDTWAALEHELKYKKSIDHQDLIVQELHRCANELAACDVSMQTLKRIIRGT